MARYPYRDLNIVLDRDFRNKLNANFDDIEADLRDADAKMNDLDARIDNIVASAGSSNTEVVDARYDSRTNTTYPTLKHRLDAHSDEIGILNEQLADEIENLESKKIDRGEPIPISQIDKNSGKFDQTYLSEELLQQMAGTTPINAVPAKNSITNQQLVNKSITQEKTDFLEVVSNNLFNKDTVIANTTIDANTGEPITSNKNFLSQFIPIKPNTPYTFDKISRIAFYTDNYEFISTTLYELPTITTVTSPSNAKYVRLVIFDDGSGRLDTAQINEGTSLLPYDKYTVRVKNNKPVATEDITDQAVTSKKRTKLGTLASFNFGDPYKLPNIDMVNKKLQFFGMTSIYWDNYRYTLQSDANAVTEVDFSAVWNDGAMTALIYFDLDTKTFRVYRSIDYGQIGENCVLVAVLHKQGNTKELIGVSMLSEYTINGMYPHEYFKSQNEVVSSYYIPMNVPDGWYEAPTVEGYEAVDHVSDNIVLDTVYTVYDDLVTNYPDYVTRTQLGLDASGTYPIYRYEFKPDDVVTSASNNKKLPKIIIITGVHGEEKSSVISLRNFMRDVANNWSTNPLLEFVRWNVHLVIIPIVNPYGFMLRRRKNANNVDLNRQGSFRWEIGGSTNPSAPDYKGTAPFSEVEAQYVRDTILSNLDAIAFYDYHMNGSSGDEYRTMFWHEFDGQINTFNELHLIAKHDIKKITIEGQKRYGIPSNSGFIGYVSYNNVNPTLAAYAYSQGIKGHVIECTRKIVGETNVYSAKTLQLCTEFIGNKILSTIRAFATITSK
jgi:hypothetical protein